MRFLFFFVSFLYASYVVELQPSEYKKIDKIGVECVKIDQKYLCNESDSKEQLKRFLNFLHQYGVNGKITFVLNHNLINVYSYQIASSKKVEYLEKLFQKYKKYPFARIEKIGSYYTLRIGASKNKENLKKLKIKEGFLRIADIKQERILKANFIYKKIKFPKEKNIKNLKREDLLNILKIKKNYKKACKVYSVLALLKNDKKTLKIRDEVCYRYYKQRYTKKNGLDKIFELERALSYKKNLNDLVTLNYLKAKNFIKISNYEINVTKLSDECFYKYAKTFLFIGDIENLNRVCRYRFKLCRNIYNFLNKRETKDKDIKNFNKMLLRIQNFIDKKEYVMATNEINRLLQVNKDNEFARFFLYQINGKDSDLNLTLLRYPSFREKIKDIKKRFKIASIKEYIANNQLKLAIKEVINLVKIYPNDLEINLLAGDIFEKTKSYLANVYYHKAYLLNKKEFFYHLLKNKNYKRLENYLEKDLNAYPYIKAKVLTKKANDLVDKKDYIKALQYAKEAYEIFPSKENSILLGRIYFELRDYKNCINYLEGFANKDVLIYYLGYSYYKIGNLAKAKKYMNKISKIKNDEIKSKLIKFYLEIGEKRKLKEILDSI